MHLIWKSGTSHSSYVKKENKYNDWTPTFYSVVARNNDILKKLVLEAKREYEKDAEHRVHIYMGDT